MKYIVDMTLEVEETMALNVERSNSTNHNLNYNGLCKYTISTNCIPLS